MTLIDVNIEYIIHFADTDDQILVVVECRLLHSVFSICGYIFQCGPHIEERVISQRRNFNFLINPRTKIVLRNSGQQNYQQFKEIVL